METSHQNTSNKSSSGGAGALNSNDLKDEEKVQFEWMVKDSSIYKEEYDDCRSFRDRFHQYFVSGEMRDCSQWKTDYDNCLKWEKDKDKEALLNVIESEKQRVRERLKGHLANDVWERREKPPENWSSELPEHIKKGYEGSFLQERADEIKKGVINMDEFYADSKQLSGSCSIC